MRERKKHLRNELKRERSDTKLQQERERCVREAEKLSERKDRK